MLKNLTGSGNIRSLSGPSLVIKNAISLLAGLYLIFAVLFYPEPILHRSIAFGLFYSVIFISYTTPKSKIINRVPLQDWMLMALSLGVSIYIGINFDRIINRFIFVDPVFTTDIIFGSITLLLLFEGTRRVLGPWLPGLSLLALMYIFFGHLIPGRFGHLKYTTDYIFDGLFLSTYGIWGSTLGIATGMIMVFLMFGTLFKNTGAGDFLFDFVAKVAGKTKGGIAKVAILSSALFGMISGGPLTNATTTGAMTIPAMKKSGFSGEYAASIESCASVGGIFMPPIMGSVVFIMSDVVGIAYFEIVKRAILPALVYFAALFFVVDFRARKMNIEGSASITSEKFIRLLLRGYNFFIPLGYLIFRLVMGRTPAKAGLETIVIMILLGLLNRKKPITLKIIVESLKTSVVKGVMIVSTMAMCGVLIGVIDITGLTAKFSSYLIYISEISIPVTLIAVMLITLFLGLAMNISSSYLIAAVLGAPILVNVGFEPLSVHMFILFFAAMATITPPVAITSYAAASIAGVSPMKVGFMSMKIGMVAYILPFAFIFKPAILLYGSFVDIILTLISALVGTAILGMGLEGWFFGVRTGYIPRIMLGIAGIMIVVGKLPLIGVSASIIAMGVAIMILNKINDKKKTIAGVKIE
ncbi:MAG: TRAP transporter fused permease subunit [Clostridia bacterium]|nr:TRAP transporter fused permease subunit [Clostridia bacterium]